MTSPKERPDTWEEAVFNIVGSLKRPVSLQEIYARMAEHLLVRSHHRKLWGSQPNYHHWVRSVLAKLKRKGLVCHVGRGLYAAIRPRGA